MHLSIISIFLLWLFIIGIAESCKTTVQPYFPITAAKAVASMKGSLNGSTISGTISFLQNVIQ